MINKIIRFLIFNFQRESNAGMVIYADHIGKHVIIDGFYEKDLVDTVLKYLLFDTSVATALDVGANIGNHTVQFSSQFGLVRGFEPQRRTYKILQLNTELLEGVEIHNVGLSNTPGDFEITIPIKNNGSASLTFEFDAEEPTYKEYIKTISYDDKFDDEIAFVKIDVEGNEASVLKSMTKTLEKYQPVIAFELHPKEATSIECLDYLSSLGYTNYFCAAESQAEKFNRSKNICIKIVRKILTVLKLRHVFNLCLNSRISSITPITMADLKASDFKHNLVVATNPQSKWRFFS